MKDFLKKMFSSNSEVSSKRFLGAVVLFEFLALIVACVVYLWMKSILEEHMATLFLPLVTLIAAFFGLTLAEKYGNKTE